MRIPWLLFSISAIIIILCDLYIYLVARKRCKSRVPERIQLISSIAAYVLLAVAVALPRRGGDDSTLRAIMWMLFIVISVYFSKITFVVFDLIASIPRLFKRRRIKWISLAGGILAVVMFLSMWWGALVNRFRLDVKYVEIPVENLPAAFDGYRIIQISDLHTGTYGNDTTFVSQFVDRINSLDGDVIMFTGDIVNRHSEELIPFIAPLSRLDAPDGVISILGNHDYGDYHNWTSLDDKAADRQHLLNYQKQIGWQLLLNSHELIHHGTDSIAVIGVENIGDPPFKIYGSLKDSYPELNDSVTKILLTHNPAHWVQDIADHNDKNIALTLSGHTHAMQIEAFGISPASWRYDQWGGLYYDKSGRHPLYVNIGAGTVGLPMRLGATPEITVITLKKAR